MIESSIKNRLVSNEAWMNILAIVVLVLLHPVMYHLGSERGYFPPDAVDYIGFAEHFLSKGLLYSEFGLEGSGRVRPPVYPFLVLIGNAFVGDFFVSSMLVSSLAAVASSIVFFLVIKTYSNALCGFVGALGIQLNYELNLWAHSPLTEASFILLLAVALLVTMHALKSNQVWPSVVLGVLLALIFLTKLFGILLVPFFLLVLLISSPRRFLVKSLGLVAGLAILLVPYMLVLSEQSSQLGAELSPFDKKWSTREQISLDDVGEDTQEYLRRLHNIGNEVYGDMYVKRRMLRELLPDSSAMLSEVEMEPASATSSGVVRRLVLVWSNIDKFVGRFLKNSLHIYESIGLFISATFLISLVTPIWKRSNRDTFLYRYLIGGFVLYYLFAMSFLSGSLARYVVILAPFMLLNIVVESAWLIRHGWWKARATTISPLILAVIVTVCVFLQPTNYSDVSLRETRSIEQMPESNFRSFVDPGEGVFSIGPLHAYVSGGSWRVMPNDSLEKIAIYAARQGVRWMVVVHKPQAEVSAYRLANSWYLDKGLLRQHKDLVELRAVSRDGGSFLFKFKE